MKPFAPMCARRGGEHAFSEMGSRVLSDRMRWRLQADHGWKHDTGDEILTRGIDTIRPLWKRSEAISVPQGGYEMSDP